MSLLLDFPDLQVIIMTIDCDDPSLVVRCTALVPHFFPDITADISEINRKLREISNAVELDPIEKGIILKACKFNNLEEILSRLWQIDGIQPASVREFGLWDVEILKHGGTEDPSLVIRSAHLLCERVFNRKKNDACEGKSD